MICLYSSTLDQQNTSFTEKRCGQANLPKGLCSLCHWVDTTLYKDKNIVELFSIFLKSKFVVFVDHDLIPPILEVLACGAVPLLASKESFLESVVEQIQDKDVKQLSVEYLSTFDNYVTEEAEKKLKTVFADMLLKKENYSIAPLTFAFWLSKVIPFDAMNSHISRQHSRHHAFVHQHLPFLRYNLQLSSGRIQNIYLQNPVKVKEFCHVPIMGNMKKTKLQMEYPTSHLAHVDSEAMVDIVLPRCCETIDGDLAWLQDIATSLTFGNKNQTWLRVHIYYKCPWCIPKSLYKTWKPLIHSSRENSTAGDILRSKGGVYLLNDFPSSTNNFIHHYPAFDWRVNGKETTVCCSSSLLIFHHFSLIASLFYCSVGLFTTHCPALSTTQLCQVYHVPSYSTITSFRFDSICTIFVICEDLSS